MAFEQYATNNKCIGLLLHLLYDVYDIKQADHWQYESGKIMHGKTQIGTYTWNADGSGATFAFNDLAYNKRIEDKIKEFKTQPFSALPQNMYTRKHLTIQNILNKEILSKT